MGVARSAYYKWLNRVIPDKEKKDQFLQKLIWVIYHDPELDKSYGYRRINLVLKNMGFNHDDKTILRITRSLGIQSVIRKKRKVYPSVNPDHVAENLLNRDFVSEAPNQKWCTDITEMKDHVGNKLYLSAVIDLYDLSIVSYRYSNRNNNQLVEETIREAFAANPQAKPLIHSDRGSQYTSYMYHGLMEEYGFVQSMSRAGYCLDNQPIERFFGLLKSEYYYRKKFNTIFQLESGLNRFIDYYNKRRVTLKFNGLTPLMFRDQYEIAS
ncbi:hypothetical protein IRB23M11_19570 [Alkalibacterium sp. m-11]